MRFTRTLHLPHPRAARHAAQARAGKHCDEPRCEVCGQARVEQVQDETLLHHQPRMQP